MPCRLPSHVPERSFFCLSRLSCRVLGRPQNGAVVRHCMFSTDPCNAPSPGLEKTMIFLKKNQTSINSIYTSVFDTQSERQTGGQTRQHKHRDQDAKANNSVKVSCKLQHFKIKMTSNQTVDELTRIWSIKWSI